MNVVLRPAPPKTIEIIETTLKALLHALAGRLSSLQA